MRLPLPHSAARMTRSRVRARFTLTQLWPRAPAAYLASVAFAIRPSWPRSSACSRNSFAAVASPVTVCGIKCSLERPESAAKRRACGSSRRALPLRYSRSNQKGVMGNSCRMRSTSSLRPKRRIVIWKGCGRPPGRRLITSPSRIRSLAGSARVTSTISGTACVTSFKLREYTLTSSPDLWTCTRAPSILYSSAASPIEASASGHVVGRLREHRLDRPKQLDVVSRQARFALFESRRGPLAQYRRPSLRRAALAPGQLRRLWRPPPA